MANVLTSKNGVAVTTTATFNIRGHKGMVNLFFQYTKGDGTSVAITAIEFVLPSISGSTLYKKNAGVMSGSNLTLTALGVTLDTTGNFIIPLADIPLEATSMKLTVAFTGGTTQALQLDAKVDVK
jgi:hypothetical protein